MNSPGSEKFGSGNSTRGGITFAVLIILCIILIALWVLHRFGGFNMSSSHMKLLFKTIFNMNSFYLLLITVGIVSIGGGAIGLDNLVWEKDKGIMDAVWLLALIVVPTYLLFNREKVVDEVKIGMQKAIFGS